jgi:hypothetical protein
MPESRLEFRLDNCSLVITSERHANNGIRDKYTMQNPLSMINFDNRSREKSFFETITDFQLQRGPKSPLF